MSENETKKRMRLSKRKRSKDQLLKDDILVVDPGAARQAVVGTAVGNAMEWFDFGVYSYLAATIGKVFFPGLTGSAQLVYSFATFAIAFLVRPIGGMVFGPLGDRIGRKKILAFTLIMMAISTLSIGFIPGYATIGVMAPILLLVARLVQGFSTGGEYAGAMTFIAESTPDKSRGRLASGLEVGTLVGYIFGSGIVTLLTYLLSPHAMLAWGWRIPFFVAAPIGIIGFYLRSHLEETPVFEKMEEAIEEKKKKQVSIKEIITHHKKPLIVGMILVFFYNVVDYAVLSYMPSHLSSVLGYGETKSLLLILIVMFIMIPITLIMGYFGDRIGGRRIVQMGLIGLIVLSIPSFLLIDNGNNGLVFLGLMILAVFLASFQGTMPALLPSLFFTNVRYGGLAITYNLSASLFGGTAPLVIAWLINLTSNIMIPAFYLIFSCVVGLIVVSFFVENTSGKALRGSPPAVADEDEIQEVLEQHEEDPLWWEDEQKEIYDKA
ncbi:MFS transporter [Pullulanibacillus sp. KACC 23026]|uniref:MFS transporter n=1 Tax=Pullulanibacillus sp. KACC 23026 TaxID=3028315 RepID=UPI0023B01325|nr:MFS transporter [Pullulanibacillus sp. KACC 23026]WEG13290.1 MFS transporter [Pullulanibacillus sp. KACC 23026]